MSYTLEQYDVVTDIESVFEEYDVVPNKYSK